MSLKKSLGVMYILAVLIFILYTLTTFTPLKKGDVVRFGSYEQDNDLSNGSETLEWIVLNVEYSEAVIICKNIIDFIPYAITKGEDIYWEDSFLRDWLNNEFYYNAFSDDEKAYIVDKEIENNANPIDQNTYFREEKVTKDRVYLLSFDELVKYGLCSDYGLYDIDVYNDRYLYVCNNNDLDYKKSNDERKCYASEYAASKYNMNNYDQEGDWNKQASYPWYLRSKGLGKELVGSIGSDGKVVLMGSDCNIARGIRPVVRIKINGSWYQDFYIMSYNTNVSLSDDPNRSDIINMDEYYSSSNSMEINNNCIVTFGNYEQDDDTTNGKEPIEWIVVQISDDDIMLLSRYILDYQRFNENDIDVLWDSCTLRHWLNDYFYNNAFNDTEKEFIISKTIKSDSVPIYMNDRYETYDKVHILSIEDVCDADKGFTTDASMEDINRRSTPTQYCEGLVHNSIYGKSETATSEGGDVVFYCLRSRRKFLGYNQISVISPQGDCTYAPVDLPTGIRPVIYLKLKHE